jgi:hypothetical protein
MIDKLSLPSPAPRHRTSQFRHSPCLPRRARRSDSAIVYHKLLSFVVITRLLVQYTNLLVMPQVGP